MEENQDNLDKLLKDAMKNISFEQNDGIDENPFADSDAEERAADQLLGSESPIKRCYSLDEYTDRAKLAYAFLTSYGFRKEVTLLHDDADDLNEAMQTFTDTDLPSYPEFEKAFNESGGMVMGIACFDYEDKDRYGLFMVPGEKPILNVYCDVQDEDMECLFAELDQKYDDLINGVERDDDGMPI